MKRFDVLGFGSVAVDDVLAVESFPPADAKTRVLSRARRLGGMTGTALAAASRLGARAAYCGKLGGDELSAFAIAALQGEGIDTSGVRPGSRPVHSTVLVAPATRNVFYDLTGVEPLSPAEVDPELVRATRVLLVDHHGAEAMALAARIAREAAIPVVADLEFCERPALRELIAAADHLIVGRELAALLCGARDAAGCVRELWTAEREAVVVTCGADGCWYAGRDGDTPRHAPAFAVDAVDTTGCGDVFHGAYAAALSRGVELARRLRYAAAAAALHASRKHGGDAPPREAEVASLLAARPG